jgi:hypothetical protein
MAHLGRFILGMSVFQNTSFAQIVGKLLKDTAPEKFKPGQDIFIFLNEELKGSIR